MIYLVDKITNEVVRTFDNVIDWGINFVEYLTNGKRGKVYCNEEQYFTDKDPSKDLE